MSSMCCLCPPSVWVPVLEQMVEVREATRDKKQFDFGFLLKGGGELFKEPFSNHRPSGPMLSISRNVHIFVCVFVCLSVCLFTFEVPFNGLFAPTSRSRMSNIFRDSESLGKRN